MNEIEKRELFEQQQKIFEAGAQRADKRTGSFSFLTWSFFIAPLIACEEFLAATFKSAAAEEEDAKAAQAGAAPQAANDDPPASDPSKTSAEDETAKGPAASSEAHAAQLDPTGLLAQPHDRRAQAEHRPQRSCRRRKRWGRGRRRRRMMAMMPIPAIMTLTPQSTIVPSTRCQRIPTSEAVNCRVGQRSNPFSPMCLATRSARRSSAPPTCLEPSVV